MSSRAKNGLRLVAAVVLLMLVAWYVDPAKLKAALARGEPAYFAAALVFAILSNVASALRWSHIARILNLAAPYRRLLLMYWRGMALNTVLPGATLSGDTLRAMQLHRLGNPLWPASLSVVFDRLTGIWTLCIMSLVAAAVVFFSGADAPRSGVGLSTFPSTEVIVLYGVVLTALIAMPFYPFHALSFPIGAHPKLAKVRYSYREFVDHSVAIRERFIGPFLVSLVVQSFSAGALWLCALAIGLPLSAVMVFALAAPIFGMSALPVSVSGWGTREFAAVAVFGLVGVESEFAAATAILYGLCGALQGVIFSPLLLTKI